LAIPIGAALICVISRAGLAMNVHPPMADDGTRAVGGLGLRIRALRALRAGSIALLLKRRYRKSGERWVPISP
jgi:hypothetical protein